MKQVAQAQENQPNRKMAKSTKSTLFTKKKDAFISAYKKSFGNITQSCEAVDIDRGTYYHWLEKYPAFKKELEAIQPEERFIDFCESKLSQRINANDTTAIIFALKTKGKKRGYIERQEITGKDGDRLIPTLVSYVENSEQQKLIENE